MKLILLLIILLNAGCETQRSAKSQKEIEVEPKYLLSINELEEKADVRLNESMESALNKFLRKPDFRKNSKSLIQHHIDHKYSLAVSSKLQYDTGNVKNIKIRYLFKDKIKKSAAGFTKLLKSLYGDKSFHFRKTYKHREQTYIEYLLWETEFGGIEYEYNQTLDKSRLFNGHSITFHDIDSFIYRFQHLSRIKEMKIWK